MVKIKSIHLKVSNVCYCVFNPWARRSRRNALAADMRTVLIGPYFLAISEQGPPILYKLLDITIRGSSLCVSYTLSRATETAAPLLQMVVQVNQPTRHYSKTMEGSQQKVEANVLLLGAESVGKSALTVRFLTRRFIGEYGDIESIYSHTDRIEGREISFNIWDSLCPQNGEVEGHISDRQLQWADGFILVYSICDRASFNVVRQQVQRIQQAKSKFPGAHPIIIVGNKRDLQHRRTVSSEEGRLLALSTDCGFFEISVAETYHEVQLVFHELFDLIREARALKKGAAGIKGIVRSMSAVFGRKRTE